MSDLRLLVYDRTCVTRLVGLSTVWSVGARGARALGRIDGAHGAASWEEALAWVVGRAAHERVAELQFWGHGRWGGALFDDDVLDVEALRSRHRLNASLSAVRDRLAEGALVWFRSCETFGAARGVAFAERLADWLGARVAGHTYVIGFHQSGLHGLVPGARADWSPGEGLAEGTGDDPVRARYSTPFAPRTITCLQTAVPERWFAR